MDIEPILSLSREQLEVLLRHDPTATKSLLGRLEQPSLKHALARAGGAVSKGRSKKAGRPFDFSKVHRRHVALHFLYLGHNYNGVAVQTVTEQTVEEELFKAMEKTKLIETRTGLDFTRCGRTDKGVSAFGQIVSLYLRCNHGEGTGVVPAPGRPADASKAEIDYCHVLNAVLPDDIRVVSWAPVEAHFNARFDCLGRTYKYFFSADGLDLEAMRDGAARLVGRHDFRNLCKMDAVNVSNFERVILSFAIERVHENVHCFHITGYAFLWHQVRCMAAVLFMIGRGDEKPDVIDWLLDVDKLPGAPVYELADDQPLCLVGSRYEELKLQTSDFAHGRLEKHLASMYSVLAVKSALVHDMLTNVRRMSETKLPHPAHVPLRNRKVRPTYEERVAALRGDKRELADRKVNLALKRKRDGGDED